jgi:hypothetical protein
MKDFGGIKKLRSLLFVVLVCAGFVALLCLTAQAATYYKVDPGATVNVDEFSTSKKVTNNNAKALFVPTKTSAEWSAFIAHPPADVILAEGLTVPDAPTGVTATVGSTTAIVSFNAPASDGGSPITGYTVTGGGTDQKGNDFISSAYFTSNPMGLTVGDFNADGKKDLASAEWQNVINIRLGVGDGTFTTGTPISTDPTYARSITSASFNSNSDTRMDLAFIKNGTNTIFIYLANSDGTFTAGTPITPGATSYPINVISADFTGDGKADLAIIKSEYNIVYFYNGTGTGTFTAGPTITLGASQLPTSMTAADFTGDGKIDLAMSLDDTTAVIYKNNGTGASYALTATLTSLGYYLTTTSADFNGDGKKDLAIASSNDNMVSIYLGVGNGTFTAGTPITIGSPNNVSSADFNADGNADLVIAAGGGAFTYFGNGKGIFTANTNSVYSEYGSYDVIPADFNGDGKMDIAISQNSVNVVLNNISTTNLTHTITGLTKGQSYTFTVTATNAMGTGPGASSPPVTPN